MSEQHNPYAHDPLTAEETQRLAKLARLYLTPDEQDALAKDMEGILAHVDSLGTVQHEAVEPYATGVQGPTELRADQVAQSLPVDEALAAAPERLGDGFGVPKILA